MPDYEEIDWELLGPNDTAKPEPTQHSLEAWNAKRDLVYRVPERLWNAPPGHYTVGVEEMLGKEVITKETAETLERRADALLARAAEIRKEFARFGEDDFEEGAVIVFNKVFHEYRGQKLYKPSKPYFYAAIKDPNGLWSTTGPKAPKSYTWTELTRWMGEGVEEIYYVTTMERFV